MSTAHLCCTTIVKTKIELDSHADTCVVDDHGPIVHVHKRPANVYRDSKAGLKHAHGVDAVITYTEPETDFDGILLIN